MGVYLNFHFLVDISVEALFVLCIPCHVQVQLHSALHDLIATPLNSILELFPR